MAPRRYGKSSLALRAVQAALQEDILVASCDLMRTPTKERLAAALAKTIHDDLASSVDQALDRATFVQRAVKALVRDDTVEQLPDRRYRLAEPFLAEWLDRDRSTRMEHGT